MLFQRSAPDFDEQYHHDSAYYPEYWEILKRAHSEVLLAREAHSRIHNLTAHSSTECASNACDLEDDALQVSLDEEKEALVKMMQSLASLENLLRSQFNFAQQISDSPKARKQRKILLESQKSLIVDVVQVYKALAQVSETLEQLTTERPKAALSIESRLSQVFTNGKSDESIHVRQQISELSHPPEHIALLQDLNTSFREQLEGLRNLSDTINGHTLILVLVSPDMSESVSADLGERQPTQTLEQLHVASRVKSRLISFGVPAESLRVHRLAHSSVNYGAILFYRVKQ